MTRRKRLATEVPEREERDGMWVRKCVAARAVLTGCKREKGVKEETRGRETMGVKRYQRYPTRGNKVADEREFAT